MLNDKVKLDYQKYGVAVFDLPQSILDMRKKGNAEFMALASHLFSEEELSNADIPKMVNRLAAKDRAKIGLLYKAMRRMPAIRQMSCAPAFVEIASELMESNLVSCCTFVAGRIDLKDEEKFQTAPHQDFPYIQGSPNGLTIWMPFAPVTKEMGIPSFILSSHNFGQLPVVEESDNAGSGTKSLIMSWGENEQPHEGDWNAPTVGEKQAVIFHTHTVHRSEPNHEDRARITLQFRFDDLAHAASISKGYPGGLFEGSKFSTSFPEFVLTTAASNLRN